mmetsp:Transcript_62655/g.110593  ORF Transcript_62655/g.110593 Transcript_62655/m.110593 type:complete len:214 (-) Transcript_62655:841-1482(-)
MVVIVLFDVRGHTVNFLFFCLFRLGIGGDFWQGFRLRHIVIFNNFLLFNRNVSERKFIRDNLLHNRRAFFFLSGPIAAQYQRVAEGIQHRGDRHRSESLGKIRRDTTAEQILRLRRIRTVSGSCVILSLRLLCLGEGLHAVSGIGSVDQRVVCSILDGLLGLHRLIISMHHEDVRLHIGGGFGSAVFVWRFRRFLGAGGRVQCIFIRHGGCLK